LSVKEIQHALVIEPGLTRIDQDVLTDEDLLISVCLGLVTVDRDSKIIRLIHHTTQEYLERKGSEHFPDAETVIAVTCLTYLSNYVQWEPIISDRPSDDEFQRRLTHYALVDYTARNWGRHALGPVESCYPDLLINVERRCCLWYWTSA
jgi:hypothetical protein